ncbi:MAG: NAD(+)/NADH kinase [Dehalococcoidia bacterium]
MKEHKQKQKSDFHKVGILYHPKLPSARALALELAQNLRESHRSAWTCSAWDEKRAVSKLEGCDLLLSIGGDGTVLRAARVALEDGIPILGINMGRVGFMNELSAEEARQKMPCLLSQSGRLEERAVLQTEVTPSKDGKSRPAKSTGPFYALNDVVIARGGVARVIRVETRIDEDLFTTYKADGVIIATATGSTSYSMAVGGPILYPQSRELILMPIAPHLTIGNPLVLSPEAKVELTVYSDRKAILSVDGQVDHALSDGDVVSISISSKTVKFLRFQPPGRFYSTVTQRLTRM